MCSFGNQCGDLKWNTCHEVTFNLDSGAAVSAAPTSLGDDCPMQIEEPKTYKTATGEPVQDEEFRVLPTEWHLFTKHLCQHRRCAMKVTETFWIPNWDKVACCTNTRTSGSGCVKKKVSAFSTFGFLWQRQMGERGRRSAV